MAGTGEILDEVSPAEPVQRAFAAAIAPCDEPVLTVIEARPGWHLVDPHELWRHRGVL